METKGAVNKNPDGQRLALSGDDLTIKLWDAFSGQELLTLQGHTQPVARTIFSPDGHYLPSADFEGTVKLWDTRTRKEVLSFRLQKAHSFPIDRTEPCVAFSPDGNRLASGDHAKVHIWNLRSGQHLLTLTPSKNYGRVRALAFSDDGRRLAAGIGHMDHTPEVRIWDIYSGKELLTLRGHSAPVTSVTFSPDDQRLASCDGDADRVGEIKLWDVHSGQELLTLKEHAKGITSVQRQLLWVSATISRST